MLNKLLLALALSLLACPTAFAASATSNVTITVKPKPPAPLTIVFTPAAPSLDCSAAAEKVVATLSTTGGDGNPVTWSALTGDTADFALSGATIVVGANGVACPPAGTASVTDTVGVSASQN